MKFCSLVIAVFVCAFALFAPAKAEAQALPVAPTGLYDVRSHLSGEAATTQLTQYGKLGAFSLDQIGFAGTTSGPNSAIWGGTILAFSWTGKFSSLVVKPFAGPSWITVANGKPSIGFMLGVSGNFN